MGGPSSAENSNSGFSPLPLSYPVTSSSVASSLSMHNAVNSSNGVKPESSSYMSSYNGTPCYNAENFQSACQTNAQGTHWSNGRGATGYHLLSQNHFSSDSQVFLFLRPSLHLALSLCYHSKE